ncbi:MULTISPECIES: MFS transporter [unclassified Streptomyces]|uniref:MFS transporter n=1 Tax=unclassified Streptomyces TaxID=2593676 RepID=UPI002E2B56D2|nr:MFS transporter [Streptomyces sp. NBC_00223]
MAAELSETSLGNGPATSRHAPSKLALPAILLAVFVVPMGITGTAVALPRIADDLGSSPALLQWAINGFNTAFAIFTLIWGVLSDRVGYKPTFVIGAALLVAASVVSTVAAGLVMLDIARLLAGVAGAAIFTGSAAILSNAYGPQARARNFALFGGVLGLGVALGPTVSGLIVAWTGWRSIFVVFGIFAAVALLLSWIIPDVRHERDPGRRLIDFSLLRNRRFLAMSLVPVAAAFGFVTLLTYLPVALSAVRDMSAGAAGLFMLPMTVPVLLGPITSSRLMARFPRLTAMAVVYVSLVLLVVGDLGMFLLNSHTPLGLIIVPMILLGFSFGLPLGLVDGEAIGSVPARSSGTAAGVLNFMRLGSEAVVIGAYSGVLAWLIRGSVATPGIADRVAAGATGHAGAYADAFHVVLWAMIALSAATGVAIALLHRAERRAAAALTPGRRRC